MILIVKDQVNTIYVTATESSTIRPLSAITYIFNFINKDTNQETGVILRNISTALTRTDKFMITEGVDITLPSGHYEYYIYEQESSTNLDANLSGELLEQGLMMVVVLCMIQEISLILILQQQSLILIMLY